MRRADLQEYFFHQLTVLRRITMIVGLSPESYETGDLVLWFEYKTRKGRCMKLNRPWAGIWEIIKKLNDVVYRIKYTGKGENASRDE